MKLACASSAFHREIESGELSQLEFLDRSAREPACDGIVFDVRHFPRTDADYLAQVKKLAADRGLSIAAMTDSCFFSYESEGMTEIFERAVALGAPLIAAPLARETQCSWSEQLSRLGAAAALAKRFNVTLALRNAPETFAGGTHDCKRAVKETDSAWLRYGPEPARLDAGSDPALLAPKTVLLWSSIASLAPESISDTRAAFVDFCGFIALDDAQGAAGAPDAARAIRAWRDALCRRQA